MELFFIGILLFVLSGVISLVCRENIKLKFITVLSLFATILTVIPAFQTLFYGLPHGIVFDWNGVFGNVPFVIDMLSAFFIIVISCVSFLCIFYSNGYMKPYLGKNKKFASHCFFLPMLTASMLLVTVVQNALFFLVVWELMSLASFFLVLFEDDKKEVLSASIKYLIYMHISVIFIIALMAFMSVKSGSYDFESFKNIFIEQPELKNIVFFLAFLGFGTKAGFVPMHNWLPDAHPVAPSHVSAVMSAVMIKTGLYGILRTLLLIETPTAVIAYFMLCIAVLTALYGIVYAVTQKDIKKILAYSSVENIGIAGIGIGVGLVGLYYDNSTVAMLGFCGALFHILNHSVFKSLLFMGAGSVYLKTHTKNIEQLGGLIKSMPKTAIFFLTACLAICALPPFNGFIGEFLIYVGLLLSLKMDTSGLFILIILSIAGLALVGTLALLCFTKIFSITFLGLPRSEHSEQVQSDVSKSMLIPMGILSCTTLLIGLGAFLIYPMIACAVSQFVETQQFFVNFESILAVLVNILVVFSILIVVIMIVFAIRKLVCRKYVVFSTWGCGYNKGNNHIQYTASSFVGPFSSIMTPLFKKIFDVKKPKGLFPQEAHYNSTIEDVEEAYLINPIVKFDEKFLSKFERLQDGNIQHYILYGLIFLILALIGVVFLG